MYLCIYLSFYTYLYIYIYVYTHTRTDERIYWYVCIYRIHDFSSFDVRLTLLQLTVFDFQTHTLTQTQVRHRDTITYTNPRTSCFLALLLLECSNHCLGMHVYVYNKSCMLCGVFWSLFARLHKRACMHVCSGTPAYVNVAAKNSTVIVASLSAVRDSANSQVFCDSSNPSHCT